MLCFIHCSSHHIASLGEKQLASGRAFSLTSEYNSDYKYLDVKNNLHFMYIILHSIDFTAAAPQKSHMVIFPERARPVPSSLGRFRKMARTV
jgi:hypothetical protein